MSERCLKAISDRAAGFKASALYVSDATGAMRLVMIAPTELRDGAITEIVRDATARTCLSCGAKEAADGSLPCNH
ncbi:hypothetical protein KTD28_06125 [Burkholderia gladioli]|uniref:hypothetical protein n=1 Tax=Burkholderia gladioli TaxID=28095 RepID=UPI00163FADD5|nr:hypothetical protein [Burkholderia gladioli]MBU9154184.1 hypothetical protein [Burkholderia gladioli]